MSEKPKTKCPTCNKEFVHLSRHVCKKSSLPPLEEVLLEMKERIIENTLPNTVAPIAEKAKKPWWKLW